MSLANKFMVWANLGESDSEKENKRRFGRARIERVDCDRGRVLDLSRTGMRLQSWRTWKDGERREISLMGQNIGTTVVAKCVWVKRESTFKHVMGLEFEGMSETTKAVIKELMHVAAPNIHEGWSDHKTEVDAVMDDMKTINEQRRKSA